MRRQKNVKKQMRVYDVKALKSCARNAIRPPRRRLTFELTHATRGKRHALLLFFSSSLLLFFLLFFFEFLTSISGCYPGQEWQERERGTSKSTCKSNSGNPALFMKINSFVVDQFLFQSFDTIIYIRRDGTGRELSFQIFG